MVQWVEACMGERRNAYKTSVGQSEEQITRKKEE
jgi:hypothetical protein